MTYLAARAAILAHLASLNWTCKPDLKVAHATRPDGKLRLWFKAQAVHYTQSTIGKHDAGDARCVTYDLDIRTMTPEKFLNFIQHCFSPAGV